MIRIVRIGDQIIEGCDDFAFYDTVTDKFLVFDNEQLFGSLEDLQQCINREYNRERWADMSTLDVRSRGIRCWQLATAAQPPLKGKDHEED